MKHTKILAILLSSLMVFALVSCKSSSEERYEKVYLDVFDTATTVVIYASSAEEASVLFDRTYDMLKYYHQLFDIYHTYPELNNACTINMNAGKAAVTVDDELIALIQTAKDMYALTNGRVNIAMGSVLSVWHDYRENGLADPDHAAIPEMEALQAAASHTDIENVVIDGTRHSVFVADGMLKLDLGAIAKGYAAQRIAQKLADSGVTSFLISIGGNVCTIGCRGDRQDWQIGVQDPTDASRMLSTVRVNNGSLVTSGDYQRYYTVNDVRYHHIIDPDTLLPSNRFVSVSVMSADSALADALSTALFNMSLDDGMKLIDSIDQTEAMWVTADGDIVLSQGFSAHVVTQ